MSLAEVDPKEVTEKLLAERREVKADEGKHYWSLSVDVLGRDQPAILTLPPGGEYFLAVASIDSPFLKGSPDELGVEVLRVLFKLQGQTLLAKVDSFEYEGATHYVTISPCSRVNWDGAKLRKRLAACAHLAGNIRAALQELSVSRGSRFR